MVTSYLLPKSYSDLDTKGQSGLSLKQVAFLFSTKQNGVKNLKPILCHEFSNNC